MNTSVFEEVWKTICSRIENPPEKSYVVDILTHRKGIDKSLEKVGEEATEFILAAKNNDYDNQVYEAADLFFHLMLALKAIDVEFSDVIAELERRHK
ncbi:phosphoribosyl-ATP diphosphatase [Methanomicrobium antiquum]|uniref:Phosphoribosyl-ATP pyrophosphatase n=1 Tax=Methanomicrobium antiquum TaxID=487686 RepID=A0AAF0JMI4_9EURY|nr:phosphoribosyl-ATP diphosphatase [Methanomicrobium antiquum]MDD3977768.1 phosphoribosyl-ATP diphosphatase [Methanomicrobium sp.]WFN37167.1 phosphoribosyl-ATP diphosphatase [Methanomicrobium antiquum]